MTVSEQAKQLYNTEWKEQFESKYSNQFVAIEPVSKAYFVADTFLAAALAAKEAFPNRQSFVLRVGHPATFHIGATA
jgi:hypothetical protein